MKKTLMVAGLALIIILVAAWFFLRKEPIEAVEGIAIEAPKEGWTTYQRENYAVNVPESYVVDPSYQYQGLGSGAEIPGLAFTIPESMSAGTNLSSDTRISIETAEGECDAARFVPPGAQSRTVVEHDVTYSVAESGDAGAGNRYEEIVYALTGSVPCRVVRYVIHSTVVENYDPGTVTAFDRAALIAEFDEIRRSLTFN